MYPRWRPEDSGPRPALPRKGDSGLGQARQDLFAEPLPDLEQQLSAELNGASWAVVDFASEDGAWCDWIYGCLNGYPLPAALVDRVTSNGFPRPDCLSIFPDRRDPSYAEHAARALHDSAYLIVVCSPQSATSEQVAESIRAFKKTGGEERIIALVVDGAPDSGHDTAARSADFEWLPAWLRWRCDDKGFCPADRTEPRIVDGRRGFASLRQMRDALLSAVVDLDAAELESLGAFTRGLPEVPEVATVTPSSMSQSFSTDFPAPPIREPSTQRDAAFMIGTALVLIAVAVIFGIKSFRELSTDDPQSTMAATPTVLPRVVRLAQSPPPPVFDETEPDPEPAVPIANPDTILEASTPVAVAPLPVAPAPAAVVKAEAAPRPNVPQIAPSQFVALTRMQPVAPVPSGAPSAAAPPVTAATVAPVATATTTADDAKLLDEMKRAEKDGDETMALRHTEEALEYYSSALGNAIEYANRKGAQPTAKDQVVKLQRKVGLLQLQNASTAEARQTYQQARKTLLQLKQQGVWSRERDKALDELESRLLSLPRD